MTDQQGADQSIHRFKMRYFPVGDSRQSGDSGNYDLRLRKLRIVASNFQRWWFAGCENAKIFLKGWLKAISAQHRKTKPEVGWVFLG